MELIFSLEEIDTIASQILATNPKKVVLFNGEMGVGKTTLIKSLAKNLGVNDVTSSPTFSLVNEYQIIDNQYIYHFDVYRLKNEMEAMDMGIEDYLYSGNWCFIEWPEKIPNCIPDQHVTITIELLPDGKRRLTLE
jgi:tRNA threonylcarbamoyladenosine biosynthesis protein TsaE